MAMATVALVAVAVGTAVSAIGQIQQGRAARKAAEHNALVAERNARISRQQAQAESEAQQRDARRRIGAARAAYGASGVTVEGSPLDVLEESASLAELDKQQILYNGELRAMGYEDTAAMERFSGKNAQRAGYMGAASTILMGAGKAMSMGAGGAPKVEGSPIDANAVYDSHTGGHF